MTHRRDALVKKWFDRVIQAYPDTTTRFLAGEKDRFRNPIGHTLHEGLSALFDGLLRTEETASWTSALNSIVKMHAVQDCTAGQAVSFPFLLKGLLRIEYAAERSRCPDEFAELEARIDEMALLAFDLYMQCRERTYAIKYNEAKRSVFMLERARSTAAQESQEDEIPSAFRGADHKSG
jgi:hypothetical protein